LSHMSGSRDDSAIVGTARVVSGTARPHSTIITSSHTLSPPTISSPVDQTIVGLILQNNLPKLNPQSPLPLYRMLFNSMATMPTSLHQFSRARVSITFRYRNSLVHLLAILLVWRPMT
jgi:hypothetical protein